MGVDTISEFLGSLAAGTRLVYVRGWEHWVDFSK